MKYYTRSATINEWVSIKHRLPEEGKTVLVYASRGEAKRGGMVYRAKYINGEWQSENGLSFSSYKISHWQPLEEKETEPNGSK